MTSTKNKEIQSSIGISIFRDQSTNPIIGDPDEISTRYGAMNSVGYNRLKIMKPYFILPSMPVQDIEDY